MRDTFASTRGNRAWLLIAGLLVGLLTWSGTAGAQDGAGFSPASGSSSCADGFDAHEVRLPSGATASSCGDATAAAPVAESDNGLTISLAKTVGFDVESCAVTTEITVTSANTDVIYCYKVTNTGTLPATSHTLVDDRLGTLLSGFAYNLAPGASTFATAAASLAGQGSVVVNVGTWTATDGVQSDDASAQAKVTIIDGPTAPTPAVATVGEGTGRLTWKAPSSNGGQVITGYRITPVDNGTPGTPITVGASMLSYDFPALTNGHTYRFDVAATTGAGDGTIAQSNTVVPQWWRPWTSGTKAVTEISTWLTGKAPTASQLSAFTAAANAGTKLPGDLVSELRDGTDATTNVDPVIRLYSAYFLRTPDSSGLNFWLNRRRAGWTLSRISDNFAGSSEFKNRYGQLSNSDYVKLVYDNVLDRAPDTAGLNYWTGQLNAKKKSRGQVMLNFSDSNEYKTKRATYVDAVSLYIQFLGKSPTPTQVTDLQTLLGTQTIAQVVRTWIHQPTFDARAG
ncbi:MAG: hypothetical protein JWO77_93 [Ilumatobacteraceae bacterium]|nr:hypothetical protein [Ilumatobacteraceae bacterium]